MCMNTQPIAMQKKLIYVLCVKESVTSNKVLKTYQCCTTRALKQIRRTGIRRRIGQIV